MVWHWCVMYRKRVNGRGLKADRKRRVDTKPSKGWQGRKLCSKTRHSSSPKRGVTEDKTGNIPGRSASGLLAHLMLQIMYCTCVWGPCMQMEVLGENERLSMTRSITHLLTGRQRVPSGWRLYLQSSWPSRPCLCDPSWGSWCQSSQTLLEASGCWPLYTSTHSNDKHRWTLIFLEKLYVFLPFFRL